MCPHSADPTSGRLGPLVGKSRMIFPKDGEFIGRISHLGGFLVLDSVATYWPDDRGSGTRQIKMTLERLDMTIAGKKVCFGTQGCHDLLLPQ